jgi:hypothetical protein
MRSRHALLLALSLANASCVSVATTVILHPITHGGTIAANRVPFVDQERAGYFAIPARALSSEASLLTLDPQRACFAITLRAEQANQHLASPEGWRVFLRASGGYQNTQPIFGPPAPTYHQTFAGSVPRQQFAGYYMDCMRVGYAMNCQQRPRYVTVREPVPVTIVTGSSSICFAHGGRIDANTSDVTLHLDAPEDVTRRMAFRWHLER